MMAPRRPGIPAVPTLNQPDLHSFLIAVRKVIERLEGIVADIETQAVAYRQSARQQRLALFIPTPADGDYVYLRPFPRGAIITNVRAVAATGTGTLTVKINATSLGGGANALSTSESSEDHIVANLATQADSLTAAISGVSGLGGLSITITYIER